MHPFYIKESERMLDGQYIVLDIEFTKSKNKTEIIQIGAQRLLSYDYGTKIKEGDSFNKLVKPLQFPNQSLLDLLGIKKEELQDAKNFERVFQEFLEWVGEENTFYVIWGTRDSKVIRKECNNYGFNQEFQSMDFIDIQSYTMLQEKIKDLPSLKSMVKKYDEFEGQEHNALDDAVNTSKILKNII